jgi:hypothetical protein
VDLSHPYGSNREKLFYATPYHVRLNGAGSNGHLGPHLFANVASGPRKLLHLDTMLGYGFTASSIAMTCCYRNDDCANARIERKTSNREHLWAFSFYFRTSRYCNMIPPFAYYKRGGRDPKRRRDEKKQCPVMAMY